MSERNDKRGSMAGGCALWLLLLLVFLSAVYVLGLGPATWLGNQFPETQEFIVAFYMPLRFLAEFCGPIRRALDRYVEFWV
jgi:hypothetical protein